MVRKVYSMLSRKRGSLHQACRCLVLQEVLLRLYMNHDQLLDPSSSDDTNPDPPFRARILLFSLSQMMQSLVFISSY